MTPQSSGRETAVSVLVGVAVVLTLTMLLPAAFDGTVSLIAALLAAAAAAVATGWILSRRARGRSAGPSGDRDDTERDIMSARLAADRGATTGHAASEAATATSMAIRTSAGLQGGR